MDASTTRYEVPVPMRDGVVLRATVSRPDSGDPVPALLVRTPYPPGVLRFDLDHVAVLRRGMAVVVVSLRGTGTSDGAFEPWCDDGPDGADTIAWCAAQDWCTGDVVTWGRSYFAQTQLFAAGERPAALRAMAVGVCPSDPYDVVHVGGALTLGSAMGWAMGQAGVQIARAVERGSADRSELAAWARAMAGITDLFRAGPAADVPVLDRWFPAWRDWLAHPARDAWWAERAIPEREAIPALFASGWHDIFVRGSLREFGRSRHPASRLVVGPWGHGAGWPAIGEVDYGQGSSAAAIGLDEDVLDFLVEGLRGRPPRADAPVRVFLMGADRWVDLPDWPPPGAAEQVLHLRVDGGLTAEAPDPGEGSAEFVHDPADPVPTVGGNNLFPWGDAAGGTGPWNRSCLDARSDVLRFVSEPLVADLDVVGVVRLDLTAMTSADDADWCVTLVDVHPDGRALTVVDGVLRARFAGGDDTEELLEPGVPHRFEVEVGPTAQRFAAGHRVRVDLAGSSFPRYDPNVGTGGSGAGSSGAQPVVGRQSVFCEADRPSRLRLPLLQPGRNDSM